jgi:hypothetical protein
VEKNDMMRKLIDEREDFIHAPKFGNSRLLMLPEEEIGRIYQESIAELKKEMNPDDDDGERA